MGWALENKRLERENFAARGFSLVELLVVVAVILIIAAIALPNFIQSRMRANESSTVQNMRNITTAQVAYSTTYSIGYSADLPSLGGTGAVVSQTSAQLIDSVLSAGTKSGYNFSYGVLTTDSGGHVTTYSLNADPISPGYSGRRHFYTDQSGVIRANDTAAASATDGPL
jgi:type IV pilus assembly protein PilA